jgi:hypothetical protein
MQLWETSSGLLYGSNRVRAISLAQDALSHCEESVYDALWGTKSHGREEYRVSKIGRAQLSKISRVSKRNLRKILLRLAEKRFIQVHEHGRADNHTPTTYIVFSYSKALDNMRKGGKTHCIRVGLGVQFVTPLIASPEDGIVKSAGDATVESPGDAMAPSPVDATSSPSEDASAVSPGDARVAHLLGINLLGKERQTDVCPECHGQKYRGIGNNRSECGRCRGTGSYPPQLKGRTGRTAAG